MSCHEPAPAAVALDTRTPTVVLVGNPNVGKSTLFNALTGARQKVVNAPGTTVELQVGTWRLPGSGPARPRVRLVDLPGTYSLLARSPDERVTADAVAGRGSVGAPDLAVVLVDATALGRSLYLLAQAARSGAAVVVAVTMSDVAAARGVRVDPARMAEVLGVPVVAVDPRAARGLTGLADAVAGALAAGTASLRGLTPGGGEDLGDAAALFDWAEGVQRALAEGDAPPAAPVRTLSDRVDRLLLDPWCGIPVFLVVMWAMFQLATTVAGPLIDGVDGLVNGTLADWLRGWLPGPAWVEGLLVDGVLAGVGTVLSFAPLMALVFLALALLEDSGYLARAAFVADRAMRAIGLDGRAMLPLVVGFGATCPRCPRPAPCRTPAAGC